MKYTERRPKGIIESFCEYQKVNKCGTRCKVNKGKMQGKMDCERVLVSNIFLTPYSVQQF